MRATLSFADGSRRHHCIADISGGNCDVADLCAANFTFLTVDSEIVLSGGDALTLLPISTTSNNPIGIDHHAPANQVVMSVHYPSGQPHNFELVAADGTRTPFSAVSGFTDEVKIATVRSGACQGGFMPGELFTGTGVPGVIARISPDGTTVQNPWVTLPDEPGLMRGSLFQDRFCAFGGDLIVVTTAGNVWRITSAGVATKVGGPLNTHLEGVTTVPDDPIKYGPWAAKILAGAEAQGRIYAIGADGRGNFYKLGINPEDFDIIPPNENFFGVDFGNHTLRGAPASAFTSMVGDVLITQEFPGFLWHVKWNGVEFETETLATVAQWEHVTFSKAGIEEVPPVPCGDGDLDEGEQCDDGNTRDGDGCSSSCQSENHHPVAVCPRCHDRYERVLLFGAGVSRRRVVGSGFGRHHHVEPGSCGPLRAGRDDSDADRDRQPRRDRLVHRHRHGGRR